MGDQKSNHSQILGSQNKEKYDNKQKDAEKKKPFVLKKFQNIPSRIDNNKKNQFNNKEEEIVENYFEKQNLE